MTIIYVLVALILGAISGALILYELLYQKKVTIKQITEFLFEEVEKEYYVVVEEDKK